MLTHEFTSKIVSEVTVNSYYWLIYLNSTRLIELIKQGFHNSFSSNDDSNNDPNNGPNNLFNLAEFQQFSDSITLKQVNDTNSYLNTISEYTNTVVSDFNSWVNVTLPSFGYKSVDNWLTYPSDKGFSLLKNYILNQTSTSPFKLAGGRFKDIYGNPTSFDVSVLFLLSCYHTGNLVACRLSNISKLKLSSLSYHQYLSELTTMVLKFVFLTYKNAIDAGLIPDIGSCLVSDLYVFVSDLFIVCLSNLADSLLLNYK